MPRKGQVLNLFPKRETATASGEMDLRVGHLTAAAAGFDLPGKSDLDLTGRRKVLFVAGAGGSGKTTTLRWACERALGANRELSLATIDAVNRDLALYFDDVAAPEAGDDVPEWLFSYAAWLAEEGKASAAVDCGAGGEVHLLGLVSAGGLGVLAEAGVEPVLLFMLTPRVADLTGLMALLEGGFWPGAVALVLNLGRSDTSRQEAEFAALRGHSLYRRALAKGAVEMTIARCFSAAAIERGGVAFEAAAGTDGPLGPGDRYRVRDWLGRMDKSFAGIASWLP